MADPIVKLKSYEDYQGLYNAKNYKGVLHINELSADPDKATIQIIMAFYYIQRIIRTDLISANVQLFTNIIRPAYAELISIYVKPKNFIKQKLTPNLLKQLTSLSSKLPELIFSNINSIDDDYKQYMTILSMPYCKDEPQCTKLKKMITQKYQDARKYFMLFQTSTNNLNKLVVGTTKLKKQTNTPLRELTPSDENIFAGLAAEFGNNNLATVGMGLQSHASGADTEELTQYKSFINTSPTHIKFIIV